MHSVALRRSEGPRSACSAAHSRDHDEEPWCTPPAGWYAAILEHSLSCLQPVLLEPAMEDVIQANLQHTHEISTACRLLFLQPQRAQLQCRAKMRACRLCQAPRPRCSLIRLRANSPTCREDARSAPKKRCSQPQDSQSSSCVPASGAAGCCHPDACPSAAPGSPFDTAPTASPPARAASSAASCAAVFCWARSTAAACAAIMVTQLLVSRVCTRLRRSAEL